MSIKVKNGKNKTNPRVPDLKTRIFVAAAALMVGASLSCSAAEPLAAYRDVSPAWSLSGFGTLGMAYHDEDDTLFRRSVDQRGGARSGHLETRIDSLIGLQLNGLIDANWSLMGQVVSRQDMDRRWRPQLTWGFVKYAPNDWSEFRAGRMAVDIYLDGDSRHVGYSYTTVRPYADVYGRLTFDTFDGMDAAFQSVLGGTLMRLKLFGGRTRGGVFLNEAKYEMNQGRTFGATLDWIGPELGLKLSWGSMTATRHPQMKELAQALFGVSQWPYLAFPEAAERAAEITETNRVTYLGLGVGWERGPLSLQLVGTDMSMSIYPGFEGWGLGATASYRRGAWKPYLSYSRSIIDPIERNLAWPAQLQRSQLQLLWENNREYLRHDQRTVGAGVRYDFADKVALKLQVDRVDAKRSSSLLDDNGNRTGSRGLTLFSATLDFVF